MRTQNWKPLAALTGFALAMGLGSCATDRSTPLGQGAGVEIEITPSSLDGTLNTEYGGSPAGVVFQVKGGSASDVYYWTITDDSGENLTLPPGLTKIPDDPTIPTVIASNRLTLRGTPSKCGRYPIRIVVHNYPQHEQILSQTIAIDIGGPTCPPPIITSSSFVFFQDFQNERRLSVSGGTLPFTWQAVSGLPSQITLNSQTGTLSGTPTSSGTFPLVVRVTDSEFRSHEKELSLEIKVVTAADFTGTWSGLLTKGFLVAAGPTGPTFTNVTGLRLSLLFQDPVLTGPPGSQTQVSSVDQGTLGATLLTGLDFSLVPGPFAGLWNGPISSLGWRLGCDPLPSGQLRCIGHSFNGPQYNAEVVLTRLNTTTQDSTVPAVAESSPANDQQNVLSFEVSVTFNEAMSGSASAALSGGAGSAGPAAFVNSDPTTVKIPLINVQSDTLYTLTLNPAGQQGLKDVAGNALAPTTISFTTGNLVPVTLSVFTEGAGTGMVSSVPPGIGCGSICSADFSVGRVVTLVATPAFGSEFLGWADTACPGIGSCVVTMNASLTVGARFEPIPSFTLSVNSNGPGNGSVTSTDGQIVCGPQCEASYPRGTSVTLQAAPDSTSTFQGWSGACAGVTVATCTVTMDAAKSVTATFNALPNYTLTVTLAGSGGGTVSATVAGSPLPLSCSGSTCTASLANGTSVSLTAAPNGTSSFDGWTGDCTSSATCSVTMSANRMVIATFTTLPSYVLTVTLAGSGSGTVSATVAGSALPLNCSGSTCTASLISGTSVSLIASPNGTSSFAGWTGACTNISACSVTMTTARNVTATFSTLPSFTLTVTLGGTGTGTVDATVGGNPVTLTCSGSTCSISLISGTSVTLTASPSGTSSFAGWTGDCSGATCSVSMTVARSVTATFTALPSYVLTVNSAGSGSGSISATVSGSLVSLSCSGSTCTGSFVSGTAVTLTATSDGTSSFVSWTGDCSGRSCTVSMTAARTVTATFNVLASYLLTMNRAGTSTGSFTATVGGSSVPLSCSASTCTASFVSGTAVTVVTTPAGGSTFDGWSGAGCSGTGVCNVTMTAALTVTATFTASNIPVAYPQTFLFAKRQIITPITLYRYMLTLTGSAPSGGPLTFRITRFPAHRDVTQWDGALPGQTYTRVDPSTGGLTALYVANASEQSVVNQTTGVITGAPVFIYVPNICHDIFAQDTFEFVAIDSAGNESLPATVTMNSTLNLCNPQ